MKRSGRARAYETVAGETCQMTVVKVHLNQIANIPDRKSPSNNNGGQIWREAF